MGTKQNCSHVRLAYQLMEANKGRFSVETMCRVLEVAPSRYYAWLKKPISERERENARLLRLIRASFDRGHGIYGAPRVFLDLREAGEICSKHRVERLMRENGLRAHGGFRIRRVVAGKAAVLIPILRRFGVEATVRPSLAFYNTSEEINRMLAVIKRLAS